MFESMKPIIFVGRNDTAKNRRAMQRAARSRIKALIKEDKIEFVRQISGVTWAETLALRNVQKRASIGRKEKSNRCHVEYHGGDQKVADDCGGACIYDR